MTNFNKKQEAIKRFIDIYYEKSGRGEGDFCLIKKMDQLKNLTDVELIRKTLTEDFDFLNDHTYLWSDYAKYCFFKDMCKFLLEELDKKS